MATKENPFQSIVIDFNARWDYVLSEKNYITIHHQSHSFIVIFILANVNQYSVIVASVCSFSISYGNSKYFIIIKRSAVQLGTKKRSAECSPPFVPMKQQLNSIVQSIQWMCSISVVIIIYRCMYICFCMNSNSMQAYEEKKPVNVWANEVKQRHTIGKREKLIFWTKSTKGTLNPLEIWRQKQYRQWARAQAEEMNMYKLLLLLLLLLLLFSLQLLSFPLLYFFEIVFFCFFIFVFACILECVSTCIIMWTFNNWLEKKEETLTVRLKDTRTASHLSWSWLGWCVLYRQNALC